MSYSNEFINAIDFGNSYFFNEDSLDRNLFVEYAKEVNIPKIMFKDMYEICLDFLYLSIQSGFSLTSRCHLVTDNLKIFLDKFGYNRNEISVTIGDVAFRGVRLYDLDKDKLISILAKGKELSSTLDAHVWLTYKAIYVFDLTIISNLIRRKLISEPEDTDDYLLSWHDKNKWELEYFPILVDNNFYNRVDERLFL